LHSPAIIAYDQLVILSSARRDTFTIYGIALQVMGTGGDGMMYHCENDVESTLISMCRTACMSPWQSASSVVLFIIPTNRDVAN
jgi:hypothetical protein